ncbi:MAG: flagellar type III secretion system pore protein FliP [Myxococcota bacterium]|nr:flagellar type III secretion system pore protein FliP [Myxococcota bacterium]
MTGCPLITTPLLMIAADGGSSAFPIAQFGVTAGITLLPFVAIAGTSFIKIALVLAITRSALGSPSVLPTSVLTALAVILSMFVMAPVASQILTALESASANLPAIQDAFGFAQARALYNAASPPLIDFLRLNTPDAEIDFFSGLANGTAQPNPGLRVLLPAFAVSEVMEAFVIGLLVFVPFLVIDLIVANTLLALGMYMLPPMAIALPLKLLLFIAVDGWHVLLSGLIVNYAI